MSSRGVGFVPGLRRIDLLQGGNGKAEESHTEDAGLASLHVGSHAVRAHHNYLALPALIRSHPVALFKTVHRVRLLAAHHNTIGGAFEGGRTLHSEGKIIELMCWLAASYRTDRPADGASTYATRPVHGIERVKLIANSLDVASSTGMSSERSDNRGLCPNHLHKSDLS